MCGRFTLQNPSDVLADLFELSEIPELKSRYNIAPTQSVAAVRSDFDDEGLELALLRWGLIPFFAKDKKMGARMINARSETVAVKPSFRAAFKRRRCLIPTDGFYEWRKDPLGKQPFHIHLESRTPFVMAGLYERWQSQEGEAIESCTILTTTPNEDTAPIHDRMPVILAAQDWQLWLDPQNDSKELLEPLLVPWQGERLVADPVAKVVNSARHDEPDCIVPIALDS